MWTPLIANVQHCPRRLDIVDDHSQMLDVINYLKVLTTKLMASPCFRSPRLADTGFTSRTTTCMITDLLTVRKRIFMTSAYKKNHVILRNTKFFLNKLFLTPFAWVTGEQIVLTSNGLITTERHKNGSRCLNNHHRNTQNRKPRPEFMISSNRTIIS